MIYVKMSKKGLPLAIKSELTSEEHQDRAWKSRWDWKSFEEVERIAPYLTAMSGKTYLPVDETANVSPRYGFVVAPVVGDEVSAGFNGDYYPEGVITKITKGWRVTTSSGAIFNRSKNTGGWRQVRGYAWMVAGHIYEQNPHF